MASFGKLVSFRGEAVGTKLTTFSADLSGLLRTVKNINWFASEMLCSGRLKLSGKYLTNIPDVEVCFHWLLADACPHPGGAGAFSHHLQADGLFEDF